MKAVEKHQVMAPVQAESGVSEEPDPFPHARPGEGGRAHARKKVSGLALVRRAKTAAFPTPRAEAFVKKHFPHITPAHWCDWRWQFANRVTSLAGMASILELAPEERQALAGACGPLPVSVTPYYASLLDPVDPAQALRKCVVPNEAESLRGPGEADDPLGEEDHSPVPGLVHRYPDRVLFLTTAVCSTYCRYCTRARVVGTRDRYPKHWDRALEYIAQNKNIRDVLLSGGDPLTMSDAKLGWLLTKLREIPHVEIVRIGTKVPAVMPQRVTPPLVRMLKAHHPLWMSLHFTHADELTPETAAACARLADAGIPLGSQTVLLAGVNDDVDTMKQLFQGLLRLRVRPYYLYQCDPIPGSGHFRTPVEKGLEIIRGLRGHTSGYAVPTFVIDAPGGGGKVPLLPGYVKGRRGDNVVLENYEDREFVYPDTAQCRKAREDR